MNAIHQMQRKISEQTAEVDALRAGIHSLKCYLHSPKFSCGSSLDGYVNRNDVLLRLADTTQDANIAAGAAVEAFNEAH